MESSSGRRSMCVFSVVSECVFPPPPPPPLSLSLTPCLEDEPKTSETDVYALGVTLWEIYERRLPFG